MGSGGKREGAGRPKGSTHKYPIGQLRDLFGEQALEVIREWLSDTDKKERRAAVRELLPYVAQKMPSAVDLGGTVTVDHAGIHRIVEEIFGGSESGNAGVSGTVDSRPEPIPHGPEGPPS